MKIQWQVIRSIAIRWAMIALDAKSELLRMLALASQAREVRSGTRVSRSYSASQAKILCMDQLVETTPRSWPTNPPEPFEFHSSV